jgi:hypothetical protein
MAVSLQEMQKRLTKLEADMPELMLKYPNPSDLMVEFFARAYSMIDPSSVHENTWAFNEIDRILQRLKISTGGD